MWFKQYRDYKPDKSLIQEPVEPGRGIIGCEMHDLNGWGTSNHIMRPRKKGIISAWLDRLLKRKPRRHPPS